jgi:NAD(P)-dependent dehydrogenase (short-subunit alcohol dehydrogenase family)
VERLSDHFNTALVTGVSSGLGLAFARMLLAEGVSVVGMSRHPEIPEATEAYQPWPIDLSDLNTLESELDTVFTKYPQIDLVINNAGFGVLGHLETMTPDAVQAQYAVMLNAPTLISARAVQAFQAGPSRGCLVNVSSLAVELPLPLMPVYNASKAALSALSESLMLDVSGSAAPYRVIDFRPGDFNTNFAQRMEGRVEWHGLDLRAVMDRHHAQAPGVERAVRGLRRALISNRSGRVRVGDWFQSKLAPLGPRLLSSRWIRALIRWYYRN